MKTILVPLDGSALARHALPLAINLAATLSADLVVLNVTPPQLNHHSEERQRQIEADGQAKLQADLEEYAPLLEQQQVNVRPMLAHGNVAEAITTTASDVEAEMIVMTTHGRTGMKRWALGSITDKVVQTSSTPVLVVRGKERPCDGPLQRIMLTLDGSALARQALPLATKLATTTGAELLLLRVATPQLSDVFHDLTQPRLDSDQLNQAQAELLDEVASYADTLQQTTVTPLVVEGFVADAISRQAQQHDVDLLVMSTHGYSAALQWALGSTANKVLQASDIPLLLVRAKNTSAKA